jgi:hypothetical protein
MARVWECSQHSGTNLLMLLAIADFSDDDGTAFPAVEKLAKKCRMSKRNAQERLKELSDSGELTILKNQGPPPKYPNLFRVNLASLGMKPTAPVRPTAPVQCNVERGAVHRVAGMKPTAPKPSVNHQEPSSEAQALSADARKAKKVDITLAQFLENCKASGEQSIPESDPVWEYARKTGITDEMISVAWVEFKAAYLTASKRYADWRQAFRNAVRRNWYKLWSIRDGDQAKWTSDGEQARRAAA